jgi:hypothetical protein
MVKKGKKKNRGKVVVPADQMIVNSSRASGPGQTNFCREDLGRRPTRWLLVETPPKVIGNQIHWIKATSQFQRQTISTTVQTEANYAFAFTDLPNVSGLAAFFDQYCIYAVSISLTPNYIEGGSNSVGFGSMCTALDYDNVNNLGSITAVAAFGTSQMVELSMGQTVQRFLKPAVAPALYGGSAFTSFGVARTWIDSASPSVPHYGFRSIFANNQVAGLVINYDVTYIIGLRNND